MSGLATIAQGKLVLQSMMFLATCLATVEKEINCKLSKSCNTLQSQAATCNGFKTIQTVVAESRTEFYFVQWLQAQKSCETSCKEGMVHAVNHLRLVSQCHCNTSCKILHRVTPAVELKSLFATIAEII